MSIPEIPLNPRINFWRVRFPRFKKIHIAREPKDGVFKTLCGRKIPCDAAFGETIAFYPGDECRRCQKNTSVKRWKRWRGQVLVVRLQKLSSDGYLPRL